MNVKTLTLAALCGLSIAGQAQAAVTSTGIINATLQLTNGCLINGSPAQSGVNFGTLDFGVHPATFSNLTATLSSGGGSSFGIRCTDGVSYTVEVVSSKNSAPTTVIGTVGTPPRYLISTTDATQGIAYSLYSDSGLSTAIDNGMLTKTSTTNNIDNYTLYGGIKGGGGSTAVKAGIYTDEINIRVTY